MAFENVIGHTGLIEQLKQAVDHERIPQSVLFLGPNGNGALPLAIDWAAYINERSGGRECDDRYQRLMHPDLHLTIPTVARKSGHKPVSNDFIQDFREAYTANPYLDYTDWMRHIDAETKQGNITVEETRAIIHKSSLKTFEAKWKVHIIWQAELMHKAGTGNRLLKTLEEPPPHSLFILIASDPDFILPTILSRTQIMRVGKLKDSEITAALQHRQGVEAQTADAIARIADGDYHYALRLAGQEQMEIDELYRQWLVACFNYGLVPSAKTVSEMYAAVSAIEKLTKEETKAFCRYGLLYLREMLAMMCQTRDRLPNKERPFASKVLTKLRFDDIYLLSEWMNDLAYQIERNVNVRLALTDTSYRMARLIKEASLAAN